MKKRLFSWGGGKKSRQAGEKLSPELPNQEQIALIKGLFSPLEAADVLLSLINDKIKFHTVQSLNLDSTYEEDTSFSERRIEELKKAKNQIKNLVIQARDQGFQLEIDSIINIKPVQAPNQY